MIPTMEEQTPRRQPSVRKKHRSTARRGDTLLHSAARAGDLSKLRQILAPDSDNEESDVERPIDWRALIARQNEAGETTLYAAADSGHAEILKELLNYADVDLASVKTNAGSDALHTAAKHGHADCVKELVNFCPELAMTTDSSNCTPLYSAATQGHAEVVADLLMANDGLLRIAKSNGKTALHSAVRGGHLEVVRALLVKGADLCGRKDNKGQTPLHMAVKGPSAEVVKELLRVDLSVINVEDKKGNTALHVATRKGREQIVRELLENKCINVNALNKLKETALDLAEKSHFMEVASKIKSALKEAGAENGKHLSQPKEGRELKQTVSDIKHDLHTQLEQIEKTQTRVSGIVNEINNFRTEGISNTVNSVTVVAVLIATIAFAAIYTVPGDYVGLPQQGPNLSLGQALIAKKVAFQVFFIFDSLGLFISLAVVVVQVSLVAWERKAQSRVIFVFNKLMWMACLCTSVAFIALSFIVVSHHGLWIAITVTIIGGTIILGTLATICYFAVRQRYGRSRSSGRKIRRSSRSRSYSWSVMADLSDSDICYSEHHKIYAI